MKIEEVKKLDDGVNGIIIEGKIIKTPKEPRDSEFGWSQMIILKDDTGEIGSWINIESAEDAYKVGQYIKIKGKVSKYVKGGKPGISLNNGNVIDEITKVDDVSQEQPISQPKPQPISQPKEYTKDDYWHDKTLREIENNKCIVRECAIKAVTELTCGQNESFQFENTYAYFNFAEEIVDYIYGNGYCKTKGEITSEAITKEFGGTTEEKPENSHDNSEKDQKIVKARELVRNPHLTEPVNDKMATVKQKKQTYGYTNEEGKEIGGIIHSQYLTKKEEEGIGKPENLTKSRAFAMWEKWYGKEGELGERDKREMTVNEKKEKDNPFVTGSEPLERKDKDDDTSLSKDMLIDKIQELRKDLHLEDDVKFTKELGCNINFKGWTEKQLTELKDKLKVAHWVKK